MLKKILFISIISVLGVFLTACQKGDIETTSKPYTVRTTNAPISTSSQILTDYIVNKKDVIFASYEEFPQADGSVKRPYTLNKAIDEMKAGETIYLLPGTYNITDGLSLVKAGSEANRNSLIAVSNETIFDFSGNDGLSISGSYWYLFNIKFTNSSGSGCKIYGNGNIIEACNSYENKGDGFVCGGAALSSSSNQFIRCASYNNNYNNSNGFSLIGNGLNNSLNNCLSYQNSQAGFYIQTKKSVLSTNCISLYNGIDEEGNINTNGTGFLFSDAGHIFENCTAFSNAGDGFYNDSNGGTVTINNSSSINNGDYNYTSKNKDTTMNLTNCLSFNNALENNSLKDIIIGNCQNCLFYYKDNDTKKYYYTGSEKSSIDTLENGIVGDVVDITDYEISITLPEEFDLKDFITIDGLVLISNFLNRNEDFQKTIIPGEEKTFFGSIYKTA